VDELQIETQTWGYVRERRNGGFVVINGASLLFIDQV
jgi:hypothetical protein